MSSSTTTLGSSSAPDNSRPSAKLPKPVFDTGITPYAFSPNRETLGGTAYLIPHSATANETSLARSNILVDCPSWTDANLDFIAQQGGIGCLVITHRGGASNVRDWQNQFNCQVVVQEQEAYLLPQIQTHTFHYELELTLDHRLLWTPGHSPGSICLYSSTNGGTLFTGRHILPTRQGSAVPLRVAKTFHWPRQLKHVQRFLDEFNPQTLTHICPGASIGFLRGKRYIDNAYAQIASLNFSELAEAPALL
ncbi:MAG: MBL fold metallo-hydrolase [Cyanobacteria bacterium P01_D01_bin.156]